MEGFEPILSRDVFGSGPQNDAMNLRGKSDS